MAYRISGLSPEPFAGLFGLSDEELAARGAVRMTADKKPGYPCRVTLEDAEPGEVVILVNHVSQPAATPFRASHAIFVREGVGEPSIYVDALPPVFDTRTIGLRGFDADGMLRDGLLALPGEADAKIRILFEKAEIASIHAHTATYGCFVAHVERN
jgi:hypothetical protein